MAQQYGTSENITARLEGPFGSAGAVVKLTQIHLPAHSWKGAVSPYSQQVAVEGVSVGSMVDIQLAPAQLDLKTLFLAENEEGAVTVYAIGNKPLQDLTLQAGLTEVVA